METEKYCFEIGLNLGCNCVGQNYDETLAAVVELTSDEAEALHGWLSSHEPDFNQLVSDLPEIHSKIYAQVQDAIWWWAAEDGIANNGYEDMGSELFEKEVREGVYVLEGVDLEEVDDLMDLENYDDLFEEWEESKNDLDDDERQEYLDARYDITESTNFGVMDYAVSFPDELL